MAKNQINCYSRPQDKHGLLRHIREKALNSMMKQLEQILIDFDVYTILDGACGDGLTTAALAGTGRAVSAADRLPESKGLLQRRLAEQGDRAPFKQADLFSLEEVYPEQFGAVFCLGSELARYADPDDAVIALLRRLDQYGVLVIGVTDMDNLPDHEDFFGMDAITPLLLGKEFGGRRCSVIQSTRQDMEWGWVETKYIYHIEDLSTGSVTVDWEDARHYIMTSKNVRDIVMESGGCLYETVKVEGGNLFLCGNGPRRQYMGPKTMEIK